MAHRTFRNQNGEIKKIPKGFNWWACLGSNLYFLYKGMPGPFFRWCLINFFATPLTLFLWLLIGPIVIGFRYEKIASEYWTEKGYKEDIGYEIGWFFNININLCLSCASSCIFSQNAFLGNSTFAFWNIRFIKYIKGNNNVNKTI